MSQCRECKGPLGDSILSICGECSVKTPQGAVEVWISQQVEDLKGQLATALRERNQALATSAQHRRELDDVKQRATGLLMKAMVHTVVVRCEGEAAIVLESLKAENHALRMRLEEKVSARELEPIHPALTRVVAAARAWANAETDSEEEHRAEVEIHQSLFGLPTPLPTIVTCNECRFLSDCEYHKCFQGGRDLGPKWCSDGKVL